MKTLVVHGDGINDDTEALQEFLDGTADLVHSDGTPFTGHRNSIGNNWGAIGKKYLTTKTLHMGRNTTDI